MKLWLIYHEFWKTYMSQGSGQMNLTIYNYYGIIVWGTRSLNLKEQQDNVFDIYYIMGLKEFTELDSRLV